MGGLKLTRLFFIILLYKLSRNSSFSPKETLPFTYTKALISSIPVIWIAGCKKLPNGINTDFPTSFMYMTIALFPTLVLLLLSSLILFRIYKSTLARKTSLRLPLPPGPQPWPIVGNLPELAYSAPGYKWLHSLLQRYATPILCVRLGSVHVIAVNSPEIAREFLKKHDATFASRPTTMATSYIRRCCPVGRSMEENAAIGCVGSADSRTRLRWLQGKRMDEADNLVHWIFNQRSTDHVYMLNVRYALRHYSANVIRKLIFNRRYFRNEGGHEGGPTKAEEEHVDALFKVLSLLYNMCVSDYMPSLRWLDIGGDERSMKEAISTVDKYHVPLIEERFRLRRGCSSSAEEEPAQDLLDVLISAKDNNSHIGSPLLSLEEIKSQVADLTYATVDNPSNAVEWALAEMMLQPELMQKAVEEIDRVVGKGRLVEESDLGQLRYVRACAKEALRLHPVAPFNLPHMSMEDCEVAGNHIPKGSHVIISRLGLGRNSSIWDDPMRFCPERFLKLDDQSVGVLELGDPELRIVSFSTGRRGCMGAALGTSMTIMLLARLLHCFHWSPASAAPVRLQEGLTDLFIAHPLHAIATPRLPLAVYP